MTRPARAVAAALLVVLLAACSDGTGRTQPTPTTPASQVPHFAGRLPVTLQPGHIVLTGPTCTPIPARHRVCSVDGSDTYAVYDEPARATLVEVRMDPNSQHTSWIVTLRFDESATGVLRATRDLAARSGAVVLVSRGGEVLAPAEVPQVSGPTIALTGLAKPDAWDLVQRFVAV